MAPSWTESYGDLARRQQAHHAMFRQIDKFGRGFIGLEEWVGFSIKHITEKVRTMKPDTMDFAHLAGVGGDRFVAFCEAALNNIHSEEYKSLYEHLFKVFVESDVEGAGKVHRQNFDALIEDAARAPRDAGVAPSTADTYQTESQKVAARNAEFNTMDEGRTGEITFEKFLSWTLTHITGKVRDYRSRARYTTSNVITPVTYAMPVTYAGSPYNVQVQGLPVQSATIPGGGLTGATVTGSSLACPVTGAVGTCPVTRVLR